MTTRFFFPLTDLKQSKDLKNEMSPLVDSFFASINKKVEVLSKRHRKERYHVMRTQRERDQQATSAINKYYEVLSSRDIRQEWSLRPTSVKDMAVSFSRRNSYNPTQESYYPSLSSFKSVASSLRGKKSYNPTLWPFTESTNHLSPNVTPTRRPASLPLRRKHGYDLPVSTAPLEPNVRVIDETSL